MVDGAAGEISTRGHAYHQRTAERSIGAPAHQRQLITHLVHRRPYVVKELDLDHRFEPANRHPNRASYNVGFGERRVPHAVIAKLFLQTLGDLEHAALALEPAGSQLRVARGIRNVLAKDDNALVAPHLVVHTDIDQVQHRTFGGVCGALGLDCEDRIGRPQILRVDVLENRSRLRQHGSKGAIAGALNLIIHLALNIEDGLPVENSFSEQPHLHA